jgi:hypothetical protein
MEKKSHKLVITLENVNQADAIALKKMFEYMQYLGNVGSSRNCTFFADGDGSFHPKVTIDYPEKLPEVKDISGVITGKEITEAKRSNQNSIVTTHEGDFIIDSDEIAWKIYH